MMKSYKYKLKVSKAVAAKFEQTPSVCRELYNAALQERRDAWRLARGSVNYYAQSAQLPAVRAERPDVATVYAQVLRDPLRRVDRAFQAFFRRVKAGRKPGFPRFRNSNRYDSFTYSQPAPSGGFKLQGDKLHLSRIGSVRVRLSRPVEGQIKSCTVKREPDGWFAVFAVEENQCRYFPKTGAGVGIDVGIENFATLSTGEAIPNPEYFMRAERELRKAQRRVSRRKRGSHRRRKAVVMLAKKYQRVSRQRLDFFHKLSLRLVREFDEVVFENLNVAGMMKNHRLAKSIGDAAWSTLISVHSAKAENAGRSVVKVPAAYTSQDCSGCGAREPKSLAVREHRCAACGLILHRDHNAALNIKGRAGLSGMGEDTPPREPRIYAL